MKSKAKPAKGSARTKRFDVGGTVGALAGLGTLAYLMSRKKKGAEGTAGEYKPQGKFPQEDGGGTSGPGMADTTSDNKPFVKPPPGVIFEKDRARDRALRQSKDPRSNLVPEGLSQQDKDTLYESDKALVRTDNSKAAKNAAKAAKDAKAAKAAKDAKSQTNDDKKVSTDNAPAPTGSDSTRSSADDVIGAGIRNARIGEKNKPYPVNLPAVKEAERRNFLQNKAGLSGKGIPTPGDKNKTEATSKVAKAVQGTIDNRSKSMARTPEQKMSEGAREVQRRRDKEKAEKLGYGIKKGGMVKKYASGGSVSSASKRADGCAIRGKTRA